MDTIEVIIWLIKKSNITSRSSVRYLPGTSQYPVRSLWSIPLFYWLPWLVRRINVFRVERGFNVCSPSFYMFLKTTLRIMRKNSTWHISNAIWGNQITQCPASCLVPSMPSVSQKGNSVWPYCSSRIPFPSTLHRRGRNIPLFSFVGMWQPHCWNAARLDGHGGSGYVLCTCLLLLWRSTTLHSASPDKQPKWARESLLATSMELRACLSMLIKCLLLIHGSFHADKHQEQPNYVFHVSYVFMYYTYLHPVETWSQIFKGFKHLIHNHFNELWQGYFLWTEPSLWDHLKQFQLQPWKYSSFRIVMAIWTLVPFPSFYKSSSLEMLWTKKEETTRFFHCSRH